MSRPHDQAHPASGAPNAPAARAGSIAAVLVLVGGACLVLYGGIALLAPAIAEPASASPVGSAPEAAASAAAPAPRSMDATWRGIVTRAEGTPVAVGASCALSAKALATAPFQTAIEVALTCGDAVLYRSSSTSSGRDRWELGEEAGDEPGAYRYTLEWNDRQTDKSARPQVAIDTLARTATIARKSKPSFRVDLAVAELSEARSGAPFYPATGARAVTFRRAVAAAGVVEAATGPAPVGVGAACEIAVRPAYATPQYDCRVLVSCGARALYGAGHSGFCRCATSAGTVAGATDEGFSPVDSDPAFDLDLGSGRAVVSDSVPSPWQVTIGPRQDRPAAAGQPRAASAGAE